MTSEAPELQVVAPAKDFKVFTQTKNKLVKDLKVERTDECLLNYMRENVSEALNEFMDIIFEQAGLGPKLKDSNDLRFLTAIDFSKVKNC